MRASTLLCFSVAAGAFALPGGLSSDSSYTNKKSTFTKGSTVTSDLEPLSNVVTTLASSTVKGSITATKTSSVAVVTPSPTKFSVSKAPIEIAPASQWLLDPAFEITSVPQTRYYNFTIDARWGQPDGLACPSLFSEIVTMILKLIPYESFSQGISQNGTGWADGPNGVTQCPIPSYQSFLYNFTLSRPDQYGTYWWHAHRGALYADGVAGPLVIHSPSDPLKRGVDYDVDQILFIRDHFHSMSSDIVNGILSNAGFEGTIVAPSPKSGLINSVGIFDCSFAPTGSTCEQKIKPLELVYPSNTKIRLRLINAGTHALFRVSADEHVLEVIEADDTPVFGPEVHRVPIYTAQRYSAVLNTAQDKSGDSFFLRAQMNTGCFAGNFTDLDPDVKAIIRIADHGTLPSTKIPKTIDWNDALNGTCVDLDEATLVPRIAVDAPRYAGTTDVFNAAFNFTPTGDGRWFLNGVTFENFMYNPLLHQIYNGRTLDSTDVTNFVIPKLEAADLIINNALGADHPFHLHGLKFYVVGRGNGTLFPSNVSETTIHIKNPLRRDTLTVPNGQFAVIRVIADIPGVHALHAAGLFGVFVVQPDAIRKFEIPDEHFKICDANNYEAGDTILTTDAGRRRRSLALSQSNSTEFPLLNQQGGSPMQRAVEMWKRAEVVRFAKEV
ncbi:hypothetical protein P7C70_g4588, partial [Phenoliferia sp. Uapishka_3]